jgi:hypothetical protein
MYSSAFNMSHLSSAIFAITQLYTLAISFLVTHFSHNLANQILINDSLLVDNHNTISANHSLSVILPIIFLNSCSDTLQSVNIFQIVFQTTLADVRIFHHRLLIDSYCLETNITPSAICCGIGVFFAMLFETLFLNVKR